MIGIGSGDQDASGVHSMSKWSLPYLSIKFYGTSRSSHYIALSPVLLIHFMQFFHTNRRHAEPGTSTSNAVWWLWWTEIEHCFSSRSCRSIAVQKVLLNWKLVSTRMMKRPEALQAASEINTQSCTSLLQSSAVPLPVPHLSLIAMTMHPPWPKFLFKYCWSMTDQWEWHFYVIRRYLHGQVTMLQPSQNRR